jgi:hypothetical protein
MGVMRVTAAITLACVCAATWLTVDTSLRPTRIGAGAFFHVGACTTSLTSTLLQTARVRSTVAGVRDALAGCLRARVVV